MDEPKKQSLPFWTLALLVWLGVIATVGIAVFLLVIFFRGPPKGTEFLFEFP